MPNARPLAEREQEFRSIVGRRRVLRLRSGHLSFWAYLGETPVPLSTLVHWKRRNWIEFVDAKRDGRRTQVVRYRVLKGAPR